MKTRFRWRIAQSAELKWWKNYLQQKDVQSYLSWKKDYWKKILHFINPYVSLEQGYRILDAACGPAGIFMILNDVEVVAVDPLLSKYESELAHFSQSWYPNVRFEESTLEHFDCSAGLYDTIFCMNAINHVADIEQSWDKLSQLLKKEGSLVLTIDAHKYNALKYLFRLIPGDILHPHQYNLNEYIAFLKEHGLVVKYIQALKRESIFDHYLIVAQKSYAKGV